MTTKGHSSTAASGFSKGELMVAAAAREIRDGELVFVGMRLPMIAFGVAKRTHAPGATGLFENGVIRDTPAPELLYTMGDSPNLLHASYCGDMLSVMSLLQQGRVNVGFLGAAEVDRFGNLNTTWGSRNGRRLAPRARSSFALRAFGYHYDDGGAALRLRRRGLPGLGASGSERGGRVKQYGM